jgi:hypothetical protein
MPVTAKLSRRFYEQFGDELTNELVAWFNSVDATYQSDLRDLNEVNFARFDAKLEQRIAEIDAKLDGLDAKWDSRISVVEARVEQRISGLEAKVEQRISGLEAKVEQRISGLEAKMDQRFAEHREGLAVFESRLTRWMFALWTSTMVAIVGLLVAVLRSK